ncbi:MAG: hypothetical protein IPJ88_08760 [Myxococcales bacterium]|nr:MAG: hypothetical protein IPJ88_08760 [Myxococcales bacterium]
MLLGCDIFSSSDSNGSNNNSADDAGADSSNGGTTVGDGSLNGADTCDGIVPVIVRDFRSVDESATLGHPDFEYVSWPDEKGIVEEQLNTTDRKPVYALDGQSSDTTHSKALFDKWYRDVPGNEQGQNKRFELSLTFEKQSDGTWRYESNRFFPLDEVAGTYGFYPENLLTDPCTEEPGFENHNTISRLRCTSLFSISRAQAKPSDSEAMMTCGCS